MNKQRIIEFFNSWADKWDAGMVINEDIIKTILDSCAVSEGKAILDVACGTGVMVPFYLERKVDSVLGVDMSDRMIEIAREKFTGNEKVSFICADVFDVKDQLFDCIVVYNSLPHFEDPEKLVCHLSQLLKEGGHLTIAHGASRERINMHHNNVMYVSRKLLAMEELSDIFQKYLEISDAVSDDRMYLITGTRR